MKQPSTITIICIISLILCFTVIGVSFGNNFNSIMGLESYLVRYYDHSGLTGMGTLALTGLTLLSFWSNLENRPVNQDLLKYAFLIGLFTAGNIELGYYNYITFLQDRFQIRFPYYLLGIFNFSLIFTFIYAVFSPRSVKRKEYVDILDDIHINEL